MSRAPLPDFGVTSVGETCIRLLRGHYSSFIAPTDSCANPLGSPLLRHLASFEESLQVVPAPAAHGSFPTLSLKIFPRMLDPLPRRSHRVLLPVSSSVSSAFPKRRLGRLPAFVPRIRLFAGPVSRMQIFLNVPASEFAHLPDRSYRCDTATGQPRLLHPGISCFVTSTRTGYANRPNTGN